jgi:DNA-binding transcriptional regulator YhcF (GntR family)
MMYELTLNPFDQTPKYKQIVQSIIADIERGKLRAGAQLPSISELSEEYYLARGTVEKSYRELRERGYINSVQGKGYYVLSREHDKLKILLVFNKLSSYKKEIYYAFLDALGNRATVDLQIHHYNADLFRQIIERNLGKYNYYVVMPHFTTSTPPEDYLSVLRSIPPEELLLIDKNVPALVGPQPAVYQDFARDIGEALDSAAPDLVKYNRMRMILPSDENFPVEIDQGFRQFCRYNDKDSAVRENARDEVMQPGTCYVVVRETDLVELIKKIRQTPYLLGRDIGLISFNETPLKEVLGITVITTDFQHMGRAAAQLLLEGRQERVRNPFAIIRRGSI